MAKKYIIKPVTLLKENWFTSFDYSYAPLEVHVLYGFSDASELVQVTPKLCKHGHYWKDAHHSLRHVKNKESCCVCKRISHRLRVNNGTHARYRAAVYTANADAHNQDCLARYYRNRESIRQQQDQKRTKTRELIKSGELSQFYVGKPCRNCGENLRYRAGGDCVNCAKRRAKFSVFLAKSNHCVEFTESELIEHIAKFMWQCAYCKKPLDLTTPRATAIDHFLPKSLGGSNTLSNLVPTCQFCNSSKGFKDPWEWYSKTPYYSVRRWNFVLNCLGKKHSNYLQIPLL